MNSLKRLLPTFILVIFVGIGIVSAATVFDEAVNGGLSNDGLNPTMVALAEGSNTITASADRFPDHRYFSIVVPANGELTAINLTSHGGDQISWFAVMAGAQFTDTANYPSESSLLSHSHIGPGIDMLPYNVLPDMVARKPMPNPMPPGTYTFRIQNYGSGVQFTLDYVLTLAPTSITLSQPTASPSTAPIAVLSVLLALTLLSRNAWFRFHKE